MITSSSGLAARERSAAANLAQEDGHGPGLLTADDGDAAGAAAPGIRQAPGRRVQGPVLLDVADQGGPADPARPGSREPGRRARRMLIT